MKRTLSLSLVPFLALTTACGESSRTVCPGSAIIESESSWDALDGCDCVGGDLVIAGSELGSLDGAKDLRCVEGSVVIKENPELTRLDGLLGLESVGGNVVVRDNPRLPGSEIDAFAAVLAESGVVGGHQSLTLSPLADDGLGTGPVPDDDDDDADDDVDDGDLDDGDLDDGDLDDGDLDDGDLDDGDLDDGDIDDGDLDDGDLDDGDLDDGDLDDDDLDDDDLDDDDIDDGFIPDCDGDAACAAAALEAAVLAFTDAVEAFVAQVDVIVALAADGDEDAVALAIEEALLLSEATRDAFNDVLGATLGAFLAGVDFEIIGDAVEDIFDTVENAEGTLFDLLEAMDDGVDLDDVEGDCQDAVDDILDALGAL